VKMWLWLVTADDYDYDEFDSFVVWARTDDEAVALILNKDDHSIRSGTQRWTAKLVPGPPDAPEIVLGSFNAG
jgi:hypothetical protein